MNKFVTLGLVGAMTLSLTACGGSRGSAAQDCSKIDGTTACWDGEHYAIEEGAKLRFGTDNDNFGKAVVALWDKTYPEAAGAVEFTNTGAAGSADTVATSQGDYPDVFMAIDGEVSRNIQHLEPLPTDLLKKVKDNTIMDYYNAGNVAGDAFAPMAYDGTTFAYNVTMMEALGLDVTDKDGDNKPDAYDTFEEIFALAKSWDGKLPKYKNKTVSVVYPLPINEPWHSYSLFSAGGFKLFPDGDPLKPGYDKPEFKTGFEFIQEAKTAGLVREANGKTTQASALDPKNDNFLLEEISPFGQVGSWNDIAGAESKNGSDFVLTTFPTYKEKPLTPFVKTKGFVVNGYTKYTSASMALLDLLYSKEGFQAMVDSSTYAPVLKDGAAQTPDLSANKTAGEMMSAFTASYPEPAYTLPNNPAKKAMDSAYYGININTYYKNVYDGKMTVDQAIADITKLADEKLAADNQ